MDPNDWYAAEILVKERLGDLRRTAESLSSHDGRPRPSLWVVVRTSKQHTSIPFSDSPSTGAGAGAAVKPWHLAPCRSSHTARPGSRVAV
jgi:hypothetical protein